MPAGDQDLARAVLNEGDEEAFRALYRRHSPRLYLFVLRLVGGFEADADDVLQETWIRACRRLGGFRWESAFSTWLLGIGLHVAMDLVRRRGREPGPWDGSEGDGLGWAPPVDERLDLETIIARLPDGYREVLVLHDVEGMKHREIAERLGITVGTSKSQLFAARRFVRSRWEDREETSHG